MLYLTCKAFYQILFDDIGVYAAGIDAASIDIDIIGIIKQRKLLHRLILIGKLGALLGQQPS